MFYIFHLKYSRVCVNSFKVVTKLPNSMNITSERNDYLIFGVLELNKIYICEIIEEI